MPKEGKPIFKRRIIYSDDEDESSNDQPILKKTKQNSKQEEEDSDEIPILQKNKQQNNKKPKTPSPSPVLKDKDEDYRPSPARASSRRSSSKSRRSPRRSASKSRRSSRRSASKSPSSAAKASARKSRTPSRALSKTPPSPANNNPKRSITSSRGQKNDKGIYAGTYPTNTVIPKDDQQRLKVLAGDIPNKIDKKWVNAHPNRNEMIAIIKKMQEFAKIAEVHAVQRLVFFLKDSTPKGGVAVTQSAKTELNNRKILDQFIKSMFKNNINKKKFANFNWKKFRDGNKNIPYDFGAENPQYKKKLSLRKNQFFIIISPNDNKDIDLESIVMNNKTPETLNFDVYDVYFNEGYNDMRFPIIHVKSSDINDKQTLQFLDLLDASERYGHYKYVPLNIIKKIINYEGSDNEISSEYGTNTKNDDSDESDDEDYYGMYMSNTKDRLITSSQDVIKNALKSFGNGANFGAILYSRTFDRNQFSVIDFKYLKYLKFRCSKEIYDGNSKDPLEIERFYNSTNKYDYEVDLTDEKGADQLASLLALIEKKDLHQPLTHAEISKIFPVSSLFVPSF